MNRKPPATSLLEVLVAAVSSGAAFAQEAPKSEYALPAELTPVREWKNGFTAE